MNTKRTKQVMFRLNEKELEQLQKKVKKSGKNQQEYIVKAVLDKEIKNTDGLKQIYPELKRQGQNLNQLIKKLNETGYVDYKNELPKLYMEISEVWQQLKLQLEAEN